MANKYEAEVIVAGGGLAGMVTTLELLDKGKRVVLFDRDTEENLGGLAVWAFGGMFFVDSKHQRKAGIKDSTELAMKDWFSFAAYEPGELWGPRWAEQFIHFTTPHVYEWLRNRNINFFPVIHWVERGLFEPGNSVPRFHLLWGTGYELIRVLKERLKNHPNRGKLQLCFRHRVNELTLSNGRVTGLVGLREDSDEPFEAIADAVVIATGGIGGNIEKIQSNWEPDWGKAPTDILNGAHRYGLGDLHDASEKINANVVNLEKQWNYAAGVRHPQARYENHGLSLVPSKSALWLNYRGERMGPVPLVTGYDTRYLVERICQEEKKYSWQVLNKTIAYKEFAISGSEHNQAVRDKKLFKFIGNVLFGNRQLVDEMLDTCPDFVTAGNFDELAEKMNALTGTSDVDPKLLKESVHRYDDQIDRGAAFHNDEQLRRIAHARQYKGDKARTCKFQKIDDNKAYPLIAIHNRILSRKSLGGIQTDLVCRVLQKPDDRGQQGNIEGLFAVGEAAGFGGGGVHGKRSLEGTFLAACVLTGRIAAATIAGEKLSS